MTRIALDVTPTPTILLYNVKPVLLAMKSRQEDVSIPMNSWTLTAMHVTAMLHSVFFVIKATSFQVLRNASNV